MLSIFHSYLLGFSFPMKKEGETALACDTSGRGRRIVLGLLLAALLVPLILPAASAQVVVFDKYETRITLEQERLHVNRVMFLKNVGANPIIPGELHFKLHELDGDKKVASKVDNFGAVDKNGNKLSTSTIERETETDLIISVWDPLLPGFFYRMTTDYDLRFRPKGILFYEINIPTEDTTIPIQGKTTSFALPRKFHVTYAPGAQVTDEEGMRVVTWEKGTEMALEYSRIPLPRLGIKAVNLFWAALIIVLVATIVLVQLKRRR